MAGHMGAERVTTQNLEVVRTDVDRGLVMIKGAVPGNKGGWVLVRVAVKRPLPDDVPTPGAFRAPTADETAHKAGADQSDAGADTATTESEE